MARLSLVFTWKFALIAAIIVGHMGPISALAETGSPDQGAIKRVKKKLTPPKSKSNPVKKTIPALPAQPIPYQTPPLSLDKPDPKATTPLDWNPEPVTLDPMATTKAPPSPPPNLVTSKPLAEPDHSPQVTNGRAEIILQCDSSVFQGKKPQSHGRFYISLFPSDLIPDHQADFRFFRADPLHQSLIKNSPCQDYMCSAQATGSVFYLYQEIRKKSALRLTLDRRTGTFSAEYSLDSRLGDRHLYEKGTCQVSTSPKPLF